MNINETLPWCEGGINILSTLVLLLGRRAVKVRNIEQHKVLMRLAVALGVAFLVVFFWRQGVLPQRTIHAPNWLHIAYWGLLLVHLPAATVLPFLVVPTVWFAIRGNYDRHRPLARILYPVWLTSNITGFISLIMVFRWGVVI